MHIIYLWFKICARSRSFAYSPSFLCHIFSQSNPTPKKYIKWQSFTFIPFHTISYPFVRWNVFERIQWLTSWAVWRVILQRKCYSAKSKRPGRVGKRLQKVHGLFSLGKRTSHRKSCRNCSSISWENSKKKQHSPRGPPTWKRTSIVMVTTVKKRMHLKGGSNLPDWFLDMQG